jgi:hypothetical protein
MRARIALVALVVVGACGAGGAGGAAADAAAGPSLLRVLAGPIASAKAADRPVLLPAALPAGGGGARLYGSGGETARGYDLQVADAPGCHDANACFVAEFVAAPGRLGGGGAAVMLAGGRHGVFVASRCGASCNPATVSWREFGLRYSIKYMGGRGQMVALADAAIAAGPR